MKQLLFYLILFCFLYPNDFKNVKVLDIKTRSEMKKYMKQISKELGVKCSHCHDMDDPSIDTKEKKIAREMIVLTENLNKTFNSDSLGHENFKNYISCWTCHRGNVKPEYAKSNN